MQANCDFGLAKLRVLARCEAHVTREDELTACAAHASADFRNTDDRRLRETHERIQKYRETGRANAGHDIAQLAGKVKMGKVKIRNCAFKHDDAKGLACVHSSEQILEALEHRAVHHVERRVTTTDPPVGGRFLDDPQW